MKLLRQLLIILLLSLVGEGLHALLPLPVPASVYGLVLMLLCLCTGILRLDQVERASDFLIEIIPVILIGTLSINHRDFPIGLFQVTLIGTFIQLNIGTFSLRSIKSN